MGPGFFTIVAFEFIRRNDIPVVRAPVVANFVRLTISTVLPIREEVTFEIGQTFVLALFQCSNVHSPSIQGPLVFMSRTRYIAQCVFAGFDQLETAA